MRIFAKKCAKMSFKKWEFKNKTEIWGEFGIVGLFFGFEIGFVWL